MISTLKEEMLEEIVRLMGPHMRRAHVTGDMAFEARMEAQESLGALHVLQQLAEFIMDRNV